MFSPQSTVNSPQANSVDHGPWTVDRGPNKEKNMNITKRYLVTGGAGFIGSHIVERLLSEGHHVCVLDNFSSGKKENLDFALSPQSTVDSPQKKKKSVDRGPRTEDFELFIGDIRDYDTCLDACNGVDYVLHEAALRSVPKSMDMPHEYNEVNIDGTVNMLKASLESKVKRFVLASSSSVYGDTDSFPQTEQDPSNLISPYALTKLAGEYYCRIFSVNHGLETVALRYFNVFGPRQSADDEYAIVIPKFTTCMLEDESPPIHGTGKQSRDFTYVANVVQANILAATTSLRNTQSAIRNANHEVFNVACGKDQTILGLVDTLNKIMGKTIKPTFTPPRQGDVFRTLADISKISSKLGYEPKVGFEQGLRMTAEWFSKTRLAECVA